MPAVRNPEILLTSLDLASRWSMSTMALQAMRRRGVGPVYVKIGPKRVRYRLADVQAFEQSFANRAAEQASADPVVLAKQRVRMAKARKALKTRQVKQQPNRWAAR